MKFLLEADGILKCKEIAGFDENKNNLIGEDVQVYGYTRYKDDTIHLIYLQRNGNLNYVIFGDGEKKESIVGSFDTKSNTYSQISVLVIKGNINLFYSYSNVINSNIYTLHHVVITSKNEEKHTIIRYISKKKNLSFTVDSDSNGNIHLLYNTVSESYSYIFYTYFNPYKKSWLTTPIKLSNSDRNNEYPFIYVDTKDNIHGICWEISFNGYTLKYYRMSSFGKEMYKWNEINIPNITQKEKPLSNIHELDNVILIDCNIYTLISEDYGITWAKKDREFVLDEHNPILEAATNANPIAIIDDSSSSNTFEKDEEVNLDKYIIDQILFNQEDMRLLLTNIIDEQLIIKSQLSALSENNNSSKNSFKKFFSS